MPPARTRCRPADTRRPWATTEIDKEAAMHAVPSTASWTVTLAEDEVLAILGHLLSSAELCLYEPELYGSFRLLDATSRLLGTVLGKEEAGHDAFLRHLK